ncbi:isochorismatase family protein [Marinisporobacter balticus]|uniref:Nicotinamidase-related amidase n=1 Tax=Marinisporobacter balticus TaxID=2018667 RepID=A0A4R2KL53_9FIRM|nr:isochorismatase family protein [Marinisporobacter balticus]TCO74761.1 nicotinamidase-related amidase [Marinisporobacter balticus]
MRILKENTVAIIIDMQERLLPHMEKSNVLLDNLKILIKGLNALDIPILVSEQYTKGLGPTVNEITQVLEQYTPLEKMSFSCFDESMIQEKIDYMNKEWIIIAGIESHICVLQTVIDLIDSGYIPIIIEDCIASRKANDKQIAIGRMQKEGAIITTYESILFELCRHAKSDAFKTISKLIK